MIAVHPRFPEYEIHSDGRVFRRLPSKKSSNKPGDEIKGRVLLSGYRQFKLVDEHGERKLVRANRLIAEAFYGPPPSDAHVAAHNDGDRLNNEVSNLRWATQKENCADLELHGTKCRGSRMPSASLTNEQVAQARLLFTSKRGEIRAIARKFGVAFSIMGRVLRNESYCNGTVRTGSRKLSPEQRLEIIQTCLSQGRAEGNALAAKHNRSPKYVASLLLDHHRATA